MEFNLPLATPWLITLVVSIIYGVHYWISGASKRKVEEDGIEERIKKLYKEEVVGLNKKIDNLVLQLDASDKKMIEMEKSQAELRKSNETMVAIFQGRDTDAITYRTEGRTTMKLIADTVPLIKETNGNCKEVLKHMDRLYELINKHLENESKMLDIKK